MGIPKAIAFRAELGLPSTRIGDEVEVPVYSPYRQALQANQPCIYAFSESIATRPPEYCSWHSVVGSLSAPGAASATTLAQPFPLISRLSSRVRKKEEVLQWWLSDPSR